MFYKKKRPEYYYCLFCDRPFVDWAKYRDHEKECLAKEQQKLDKQWEGKNK